MVYAPVKTTSVQHTADARAAGQCLPPYFCRPLWLLQRPPTAPDSPAGPEDCPRNSYKRVVEITPGDEAADAMRVAAGQTMFAAQPSAVRSRRSGVLRHLQRAPRKPKDLPETTEGNENSPLTLFACWSSTLALTDSKLETNESDILKT